MTIHPAAANRVFHPCQQAFVVAVPFSYCNDLDMTDTANKAKILIVDDEKDITAILKSGLQKHGFSVDAFNDPRDPFAFHLRTIMEL